MSDIEHPRINRPRDEGVIVSRVESEKKDKVPFAQLSSSSRGKRILAATFFNTLKRLFDLFDSTEEGADLSTKVIDRQTVLGTLLEFKKLLIRLYKEDLSQNAEFAQELSGHWLKIQDDFDKLQQMERKGSKKVAVFRRTLDLISHYPIGADHCLGYYLNEQAGKDWLPFPFIEILSNLHKDYRQKGDKSTLAQWMREIDLVSKELRGKMPL